MGGGAGTGGTAGAAGAGGSSGAGGSWTPPGIVAACGKPTVQPGVKYSPAKGSRLWPVDISWGGSQAAVAWGETTTAQFTEIRLQRLSAKGEAVGDAISLSSGPFTGLTVTVASSPAAHAACWDQGETGPISCAGIVAESGASTNGFSVAGSVPALAYGISGFVLVYQADGKVMAQALDSTAQAVGAPVQILAEADQRAALVATQSGYAAALGTNSSSQKGPLALYRLAPDLSVQGGPITIAPSPWSANQIGLAAAGEKVAAVWTDSAQVSAVVVDAAGTAGAVTKIDAVGAASSYGRVSAADGQDSFAFSWSAMEGYIGYRAMSGTGTPAGDPLQVANMNWDDNPNAMTAVSDGYLLAAVSEMSLDKLTVYHLGCP